MFVCISSCYQWMGIICNCLKSELCRHCEGSIKIQVMLMQNAYDICFYTADMLWNSTDGRVIKEGEVRHGVITLCILYNYPSLLHTQCSNKYRFVEYHSKTPSRWGLQLTAKQKLQLIIVIFDTGSGCFSYTHYHTYRWYCDGLMLSVLWIVICHIIAPVICVVFR